MRDSEFFQDETWIFKNISTNWLWQPSVHDDMGVEYQVPSGSGDRSIISHLGSRQSGLLGGELLLFTCRKRADPDFHTEMNQEVFKNWLQNFVFPKLQSRGGKFISVLHRAN